MADLVGVNMDPEQMSDIEVLNHAKSLVARLEASLPSRVFPASISFTAKIPFKAFYLRELLIHRAAEISSAACDLFERGRLVAAFVLTRALLETVASLYCLYKRVSQVKDPASLADIDTFLKRSLFGSRKAEIEIQAINVLTLVNQVSKDLPEFQASYDILSEFAHPNWSGLTGAYGKTDTDKLWVDLGSKVAQVPPRIGLSSFVGALEMFIHYYDDLADRLPPFIKICEAALEPKTI